VAADFSISVVIPLFDKEKSIAKTLRSVLGQTRAPDQILIVDDGSTDRSVSIAEAVLAAADPPVRFRIVAQENAGVSAARNRGAALARSRYIAFLDADDEWLPGYLEEVQRLATAFPGAGVLTIRFAARSIDGTIKPRPSRLGDRHFGLLHRPLRHLRESGGMVHSSSLTVRRDAWTRSGGFMAGAREGEDICLWLKLGLSEVFAHSGTPLCLFHEEHSEAESRKDAVDCHFAYFLGTEAGRSCLTNKDLARLLASHLPRRILFRRLAGHIEVQPALRRLSRGLPLPARTACLLASTLPLWWLKPAIRLQRASRAAAGAAWRLRHNRPRFRRASPRRFRRFGPAAD
jgi:glycosyltransferase involved in cell wall biosynthesis